LEKFNSQFGVWHPAPRASGLHVLNCYINNSFYCCLGARVAAKNNGVAGCSQKRKAADTVMNAAKKRKGCLW
jgi:hypothetical protein